MNNANGAPAIEPTNGKLKTVHFNDGEDMNFFKEVVKEAPVQNETVSLSDYDFCRVTKEKDIPHHEPTITIARAAIASPGNITGVSAAAKAGKTALKGVMEAGAISKDGEID